MSMRLTRCYLPAALSADSDLMLPRPASLHVAKVLRLRAGAQLTLFDGRGGEYEAVIVALERDGMVRVRTGAHRAIEREAPVAITLLQCLVRGERMDLIVQKATELGAAAIVPVESQYSVVRLELSAAERRQQHWSAIAVGACEQCGRNRLPEIRAVQAFEHACRSALAAATHDENVRLALDPTGTQSLASMLPKRQASATAAITLLVGPEGGFSADELNLAQRHGFVICQLGPRILRAETAPLAALATIQALLGDFRAPTETRT